MTIKMSGGVFTSFEGKAMNNKTAVGYSRVSIEKLVKEEYLQTQKEKIQAYCRFKSWELKDIYVEEDIRDAAEIRPRLDKLLADAANHEFDIVIVTDLNRFGRDLLDLKQNIEALKSFGISFVSIDDGIDGASSSDGDLIINLLGAIYRFERDSIIQRTQKKRLAEWKGKRTFVGSLPYCYTWNKKTQQVETISDEVAVYQRIVTSFLDLGVSLTKLALELEKESVPTRRLGNKWCTGVLSQILSYDVYCTGRLVTKNAVYDCKPLIYPSKWNALQEKLKDAKSRSGRPAKAAEVFLLHGLLQCGHCGSKIMTHYSPVPRKSGEYLRRYVCYWHEANPSKLAGHPRCPLERLSADNLEEQVMRSLQRHLLDFNPNPKRWDEKEKELQQEIALLENEKREWNSSFENLDRLRKETNFDPVAWVKMYEDDTAAVQRIERNISEKRDELGKVGQSKSDAEFLCEFGTEVLAHLRIFVQNILTAPLQVRQRLIAGSIAGRIVVKSLPDGLYEISIPWRFNLPLLRQILNEVTPPQPPTGTDGGAVSRDLEERWKLHFGSRTNPM